MFFGLPARVSQPETFFFAEKSSGASDRQPRLSDVARRHSNHLDSSQEHRETHQCVRSESPPSPATSAVQRGAIADSLWMDAIWAFIFSCEH